MERFDDLFNVGKLISGFLKDDLTGDEKRELENWCNARPENRSQFERLTDKSKLKNDYAFYRQSDKEQAWKRIVKENGNKKHTRSYAIFYRIAIAASVLLFLSVGFYLFTAKTSRQVANNEINDIAPGGNKAILTLSNGTKIDLTQAKNGRLALQGQVTINKTQNGQVVYLAPDQKDKLVAYNTISTPRGGQYYLVLADGTKVWLNAASSIRFPAAFNGYERKVEITGEVYFEVIHNQKMPFRVIAQNQLIEDIGTQFNINAYADEPVIGTTLLEGSVSVSNTSQKVVLKPGQQANSLAGNTSIDVKIADIDRIMAWKKGLFSFENTPIQVVMRQLSRWYNVDIEYPNGVPNTLFTGDMERNINASQVLDILSYFKVHFRIENGKDRKKIVVLP